MSQQSDQVGVPQVDEETTEEGVEWYRRPVEDAISEFETSIDSGLARTEVQTRLETYGPNRIEAAEPPSWFSFFWRHLTEFVSLLLIFVGTVSLVAYVVDPASSIDRLATGIILYLIVLINATVGAQQEYRSVNTARELQEMMETMATVVRDGELERITSDDLVPGDIVVLESGDQIPADMRLYETSDLEAEEAVLTGESTSVEKEEGMLGDERPLADRSNMGFMNTFVTRGQGRGVVVGTGRNTQMGKIAEVTETREKETPFVDEVDETARTISYLAIALVFVSSAVFAYYGKDLFQIFLLAAALIVGAIPAAFPVTVTYSLTNAMRKMAKENALVKNLALLETVGGVDVIGTDKTGTLTENRMTIRKVLLPGEGEWLAGEFEVSNHRELVNCTLLANEAEESEDGYLGVPEDIGLIQFVDDRDFEPDKLRRRAERIDFQPFSSERKMVQGVFRLDGETARYAKGAPGTIMDRCEKALVDGQTVEFTDEMREEIRDGIERFAGEALRNLAFSYAPGDGELDEDATDEVFLGVIGMWDPPRDGVPDAIQTMYDAGIEVKMITGDAKPTAMAIAEECGFKDIDAVAWEDVKDADEDDMERIVQENNVFARMDPEMKMDMVDALHRLDQRVALTGDGVNDVPPITASEVGIAMGQRGSDITRDAADIILLDDAFPTIRSAILYGRTVLTNVRKTANYLLTANLFEVVVVFIAALFSFTPFRAIQLLWVNFATDIFPAMGLGIDPPHPGIMEKKPTGKSEKILNQRVWYLLGGVGIIKVAFAFATFFLVLSISKGSNTILGYTGDLTLAQSTIFVWLGFSHIIRVFTIRWDEKWRGMKIFVNRFVNYALLWPVVSFVIILYTPLHGFFHTEPLPLWAWGILLVSIGLGAVCAIAYAEGVDRYLGGYGEAEY